jgi:molecular chaperone HtpG
MGKKQNKTKRGTIKADFPGLIQLLAKNLYPNEDAFIRELLQNAHDSIVKRQSMGAAPAGRIDIDVNATVNTLNFTDNGAGMTEQEIVAYLSTIGRSGTGELRTQLEQLDRRQAETLIGRFGIGILSAFVVAKKVEVRTCSAGPERITLLWTADGGPKYTLESLGKGKPGTSVTVHLKPECRGMTVPDILEETVQKYADFLPFPIFINGKGPANTMHAPWHRSYGNEQERKEAYWEWVNKRFPDIPLEVIPVHMETPHPVNGVLYISDRHLPDINMAGMLDIYQSRMFVCSGDRNLLPLWAKFVRGVVDSPALQPTAARDAVQQDAVHDQIRRALGILIIDTLKNLARRNRTRFRRLMEWHHYHIKGMALEFEDFFDAICDTVLFEVSLPQAEAGRNLSTDMHSFQMLTLPEYLKLQTEEEPMEDGQKRKVIYYISEQGAAQQFYRLCRAKGILAMNASLVFEEEFLKKWSAKYPEHAILRRVDIAEGGAIFEKLSENERKQYSDLEFHFSKLLDEVLSEQATIVRTERFGPSDIPAVLTQTADAEVFHRLEHLANLRVMSQDLSEAVHEILGIQKSRIKPIVLHLNAANPLIERLSQEDLGDAVVKDALLSLYNNAFLYSRHYLNVENLEALHSQTLRSLEHLLEMRKEQKQLREQVSRLASLHAVPGQENVPTNSHASICVILPGKPEYDLVEQALKQVLEDDPYYFELVRSEVAFAGTSSQVDLPRLLTEADSVLADITHGPPTLMFALGLLSAKKPEKPIVMLTRQNNGAPPLVIEGNSLINFEIPKEGDSTGIHTLEVKFREAFGSIQALTELQEKRAERYLSTTYIRRRDLRGLLKPNEAEAIAKGFRTIEEFEKADVEEIQLKTGLAKRAAAMVRLCIATEEETS